MNNSDKEKHIVDLDETIVMEESFLKELNQSIDRVIEEKKHLDIDYNLLEKALGTMLKNYSGIEFNHIPVVTPIEKSEMLGITLDFFKSIDSDFYKQAIEIMLQQHKDIKMNIYNFHRVKDFSKRNEFGMLEYTKEGSVQWNDKNATVNIPTKTEVNSREEKIFSEDTCTLEDLYTVVHEISHLFDLDLERYKASQEELKGGRKILKESVTRELLGEATAIAFEGMLTEYLLKNTNYSKQAIGEISKVRINSSISDAILVYAKLLLANEKSQNGEITLKFIEELIKNNNISTQYIRHMARNIIADPRDMLYEKKYAIGGLIAPTIIKKHKEEGTSVIKKYLEEAKADNLIGALGVLGIDINEQGLSQLINNVKKQISSLSMEER